MGEVQLLKAAPSKRHSKVEFASEEEKAKPAELLLTVPEGPEVMMVSGGVVPGCRFGFASSPWASVRLVGVLQVPVHHSFG